MHGLHPTLSRDAFKDCVSKARVILTHQELFFSIDYAIEAGYQVAEIGACVFARSSLISV